MTVPISSLLAASALGCSDSSLVWVLDTRDHSPELVLAVSDKNLLARLTVDLNAEHF